MEPLELEFTAAWPSKGKAPGSDRLSSPPPLMNEMKLDTTTHEWRRKPLTAPRARVVLILMPLSDA